MIQVTTTPSSTAIPPNTGMVNTVSQLSSSTRLSTSFSVLSPSFIIFLLVYCYFLKMSIVLSTVYFAKFFIIFLCIFTFISLNFFIFLIKFPRRNGSSNFHLFFHKENAQFLFFNSLLFLQNSDFFDFLLEKILSFSL
jgi:hypothetical protein